jgi:hypothetical protein
MRERLATASEALATAAEAGSDHADRLADLSEQLGTLAERDRHVDHGRLARIQNALDDIQPEVADEAAAKIADADEAITAFRETIEGV